MQVCKHISAFINAPGDGRSTSAIILPFSSLSFYELEQYEEKAKMDECITYIDIERYCVGPGRLDNGEYIDIKSYSSFLYKITYCFAILLHWQICTFSLLFCLIRSERKELYQRRPYLFFCTSLSQ